MIALIPQILQVLPLAITSTQSFITWIEGVRASAQQSGEWTAEAEAAFIAWLLVLAKSGQWQSQDALPPTTTTIAPPSNT